MYVYTVIICRVSTSLFRRICDIEARHVRFKLRLNSTWSVHLMDRLSLYSTGLCCNPCDMGLPVLDLCYVLEYLLVSRRLITYCCTDGSHNQLISSMPRTCTWCTPQSSRPTSVRSSPRQMTPTPSLVRFSCTRGSEASDNSRSQVRSHTVSLLASSLPYPPLCYLFSSISIVASSITRLQTYIHWSNCRLIPQIAMADGLVPWLLLLFSSLLYSVITLVLVPGPVFVFTSVSLSHLLCSSSSPSFIIYSLRFQCSFPTPYISGCAVLDVWIYLEPMLDVTRVIRASRACDLSFLLLPRSFMLRDVIPHPFSSGLSFSIHAFIFFSPLYISQTFQAHPSLLPNGYLHIHLRTMSRIASRRVYARILRYIMFRSRCGPGACEVGDGMSFGVEERVCLSFYFSWRFFDQSPLFVFFLCIYHSTPFSPFIFPTIPPNPLVPRPAASKCIFPTSSPCGRARNVPNTNVGRYLSTPQCSLSLNGSK